MTPAPVGHHCPTCVAEGRKQARRIRRPFARPRSVATTLLAINLAVFGIDAVLGLAGRPRALLDAGAMIPSLVAGGEWWRLLTAAFLHGNIGHLGMNMLVLWYVGAPLETALGRGRFLLLYLVSGLAGSAGALLLSPDAVTVGASGAVYGVFGAALVLERQGVHVLGGNAFGLVVINLLFTFAFARFGISVGGHLGGLAGGALAMLAFSRLGRAHGLYGRPGMLGIAGVLAVGIASVLVSYLQVQRFL